MKTPGDGQTTRGLTLVLTYKSTWHYNQDQHQDFELPWEPQTSYNLKDHYHGQWFPSQARFVQIMMYGDSPTPHGELIFELKETAVSPPINVKCMQDKAVQFSPDHMDETTSAVTIHQTLAANDLDHSYQIQHCPVVWTTSNRRSLENEEAIEHIEEIPLTTEVHAKSLDMTGEQITCETDKIDGTWPMEEECKPDDGCGIQCLYYTMQCCECTIL